MADAAGACDWLCNPEAEVSAHYLISRGGTVTRLVSEDKRAWHAGAGRWGSIADVNSHSIGIELDNDGVSPFAEPLMASLEALLPQIMSCWQISAKGVIGHSDMAPGRKIDPGPRFDWRRLARQGLAVWPSAPTDAVVDEARFLAALTLFGMTAESDLSTRLSAFRARFRPGATGALDVADMALAQDLAQRFPVDAGASSA